MVKVSPRHIRSGAIRGNLSVAGCLLLGGFLVATAIIYFDLEVISSLKVSVPESREEEAPENMKIMSNAIRIGTPTAPPKPKPAEKETAYSTCSATLDQLCSENELTISMAAVPHTASSTTSNVFRKAEEAWENSPSNGFECADPRKSLESTCLCNGDTAIVPSNVTHLFRCVTKRLRFGGKRHSPYNSISHGQSSSRAGVFTILRQSDQFVLSQYSMRRIWDTPWATMYPNATSVSDVTPVEWISDDWWRHNLFTKMLATSSKLIWAGRFKPEMMLPSKDDSDRQNALGEKSEWLKTALENLAGMPFFGLMHRLTESFELMGFHCCFPVEMAARAGKEPRIVSSNLKQVVDERFVLDALLLKEAEKLFDALVADMRRKKAQGVMCDMSRLLREPDMEIGIKCV